jgi:hypothetical protein
MDRSAWHPKTRAALADRSDSEIAALGRDALLEISGVGPKTVDAVLASVAAGRGTPRAPGAAGVSFPPAASGAAPEPNGHRFCHFPAAASLFPAILEASGGDATYSSEKAAETAGTMGAWESEIARASLDMLREFYRAGRIPTPQDARECVRLVRHLFAEVSAPTPSPYDEPTEPDEWPAEET